MVARACASAGGARRSSTRARPRRACAASRRRRSPPAAATNHRIGLFDAILIKENHAALAGGVGEAVRRRAGRAPGPPLEVEVRDDAEVDEALAAGADAAPARQHDARAAARGGGARRRPRAARGERRDRPRRQLWACDQKWARLHIARGADALGSRARPLPGPGGLLPMTPLLELDEHPCAAGRGPRARRASATPSSSPTTTSCPRSRTSPTTSATRSGLSQQAAATDADVIAFCGVHFMAETASILSPEKTVLIPDLDAGCSLADSITAEQLRAWKAKHPGAIVVMYVNTTAEVKAETDYCCTSSNAVAGRRAHLPRARRRTPRSSSAPTCSSAPTSRSRPGARCTSGTASATSTPASARATSREMRAAHPGADFLIHPECGCSTSVMEYVAAGDVDAEGVHMLSTGGMLDYARDAPAGQDGDRRHRDRDAAPAARWRRRTSTSSPPTSGASAAT